MLAETANAAESVIEAFKDLNANILVQEFIKEANGKDLRLFVIDGKVVAAIQRVALAGEFRANIHLGGTASVIKPTAEEKKIPFQRLASSRVTGTDTDAFAYSNGGVASALISLPLRYMHTTVEMVHRDDVENVIKLIYETLLKMENEETFSYFK